MRACIFLLYVFALCSPALASSGGDPEKAVPDRKGVLAAVTMELEDEHYCAPILNDSFSRAVWKRFLTTLDRDKDIYLRTDIRGLRPYATGIDDELHASSTAFFDTAVALYKARLAEVMKVYSGMLDQPLALHSHLKTLTDREKSDYPADRKERDLLWQRRIRTDVLNKLVELQAVEPSATFAALEKKAREKVRQSLDAKLRRTLTSLGEDDQFSQYVNVITTCVDPHSNYFPPVVSRTVNEQLSRRYYGLGMELSMADGPVVIQRLFPGGNAFKSGLLRVNDRIVGVSDEKGEMTDVSEMNSTEVSRMIRGDKGTSVRLLIDRPGAGRKTVEVERGEIIDQQTGIRSAIIHRGGQAWGYIFLPEFYEDVAKAEGPHCARDIAEKVQELKKLGAEGLVIDLRNNPGGSLNEVVKMASLFIDGGPVVQLREKEGVRGMGKFRDSSGAFYTGPMTVLVNESSASASEIFAAAMQGYQRAVIIGSPTYGKGSAQEGRMLGKVADKRKGTPAVSYGSMRLTTKKFYRITGDATQLKGVIPDVLVPDGGEYLPIREKNGFGPLAWDQVAPMVFQPCPLPRYKEAIAQAVARVSQDSGMASVRAQTEWFREHSEGPFALDYVEYQRKIAEFKAHRQRLEAASRLPAGRELNLQSTGDDSSAVSSGRTAVMRQQDSALSRDATLQLALNVLESMKGGVVQPKLSLHGVISGAPDGAMVYLSAFSSDDLDSARVKDLQFQFDRPLPNGGDVYTISIGKAATAPSSFNLYLAPGEVKINGSWSDFNKSTVTGSSFVGDWQEVQGMIKSVAAAGLDKAGRQKKLAELGEQWVNEHPASGVSAYVVQSLISPAIPRDEIPNWLGKLEGEAQNSAIAIEMTYRMETDVTTRPGHAAPMFTALDTAGRSVSLSDYRGKYVLLDFWASWCGPCKNLNPIYKGMYEKFKSRNFVILGVSLDMGQKVWLDAIRNDGLTWPQLIDPRGFGGSRVSKLYHIVGVPANFLIDPNGIIVGTNIGDEKTLESKMH